MYTVTTTEFTIFTTPSITSFIKYPECPFVEYIESNNNKITWYI